MWNDKRRHGRGGWGAWRHPARRPQGWRARENGRPWWRNFPTCIALASLEPILEEEAEEPRDEKQDEKKKL
ncbi:MAG: hypothetical protein OEU26_12725 [Candidatus Tectomicrobia bacterium]|nr:hypothetical protein [Candidatus Tectomicrobia bacterium]